VHILRRTRIAWRERHVDGAAVRVSENVGPAVVGLRRMDVVIPDWVLGLDAPLRSIVLRHEEEHRRARDPYLLFAAALATAMIPWNPFLWVQARRLRLAIEMDCDARVLRRHPSPERYGLLMLTIAQRRTTTPTLFAPMLSEPVTQLERRIKAMQNISGRVSRATIVGGSLIAAAIVAFACSVQPDSPAAPKQTASRSASRGPQRVNDNQTYFEFQVEKQAAVMPGNPAPRYPDMLRSAHVEGEVLAQFVVDTSGQADMSTFKVLKSTHDLFVQSVKAVLPNMKFYPAEVGGRKVKQLVQMPFQFSLNKS
jgi:TonB family protein